MEPTTTLNKTLFISIYEKQIDSDTLWVIEKSIKSK